MQISKKLIALLMSGVALFSGCSDDNELKEQITLNGEKFSLKDANIYLAEESTYADHLYRDYFITDGTYTNANGSDGWSIGAYDNATFYLAIELAVPEGETIGAGKYPQLYNWSNSGADDNISYIYLETAAEDETYVEIYTGEDVVDDSPVVVSGGVDDGETMTLKFDGKVIYYYYNGTNWVEEEKRITIAFKGKVSDVRDVNPPTL